MQKHRDGKDNSKLIECRQSGVPLGGSCFTGIKVFLHLCLLICFSLSSFSCSKITWPLIVTLPGYGSVKSGDVAASLMFVFCTQPMSQCTSVNAPCMESERE